MLLSCKDLTENTNMLQDTSLTLQPQTISFLDLPPELRNKIYEMALVKYESSLDFMDQLGYLTAPWAKAAFQQPALTKVSKAIRQESLPVFYGQTFVVNALNTLPCNTFVMTWLKNMGPQYRRMLVNFTAWAKQPDTTQRNIRSCRYTISQHFKDTGISISGEKFEPKPRFVFNGTPDRALGWAKVKFTD